MNNAFEIMEQRHSVRRYTNRVIENNIKNSITNEIEQINNESGLKFVLCTNNDEIFKANQPHYGSFSGCRNCIVLYGGKKDDEKVGYYGERLVLYAQSIGLNTCWVAMTFEKKSIPFTTPDGMVLHDVIALGYGETSGVPHKTKPIDKLAKISDSSPEWFIRGVKAAMLAPTAINQQRFYIEQTDSNKVKIKALLGPCYKTDLGIVKYHFEIGAGKENFEWDN